MIATARTPDVAPGAKWDLMTRADRREAVKAAVATAVDALNLKNQLGVDNGVNLG